MKNSLALTPQQRTNRLKLIWGLISLIGPTVLIVTVIIAYAIVNLTLGSVYTDSSDGSQFGSSGIYVTLVNVIMYVVGSIAVLTLLPGIVVGIVLLATRK